MCALASEFGARRAVGAATPAIARWASWLAASAPADAIEVLPTAVWLVSLRMLPNLTPTT